VLLLSGSVMPHAASFGQFASASAQATAAQATTTAPSSVVSCVAQSDKRVHCAADTSGGVALQRSTGDGTCLLGRSWGYDDTGIWVSDRCGGDFLLGGQSAPQETPKKRPPEYIPNLGFLLYSGDKAEIYFRLFSYARYLNQRSLDGTHVDFFGHTQTLQQRQDIQLNEFFSPFSGWFLTPKFRYYLYVWSANTAQGDPAQVVGAGNLSYTFNKALTAGFGITSLPSTRSTEGQFPYWLGVDDRLTADEFFRGSYTDGVWLKGDIGAKAKYMAMLGDNLSILGVSASRLNNKLDTQSYMIAWMPTTGEFGLYGTFGDYDYHEKVATRLGAHYTRSLEDLQSQPGSEEIENTQIRLTDGTIIFTRDLFGPGINVNEVLYRMMSLDGGIKYHGMSLEGEYYRRWLSDFSGDNTSGIPNITDDGFQLQSSAMFIPKILQGYFSGSRILGDFGNASELRAGANWYFTKQRGLRFNGEWIHLNDCPVGYTAVPYPVGGNGNLFHFNVEMNF